MRAIDVFGRLALVFACLTVPAIASADDDEVGLCVDGVLSIAPTVEITGDGELTVTRFEADDDGVSYRVKAVKYTCESCDTGTCYPTWNGTSAGCTSQTCTTCALMANGSPADRVGNGCGSDPSDATLDAIAARVATVATYSDALDLPAAIYDDAGQEATAPDGFELAVEEIDGIAIAYVVPIDGDGPAGAPLRLKARKAKCDCSGSGGCHWAGIVCQGANCNDGCEITVRGGAASGG